MSDRPISHLSAAMTVDVRVPFRYTIIHGADPSRRSSEHKAATKSLNLVGLSFETTTMDQDGFHLSFTESSYGRNSLEIVLDLGKKFGEIEILGQVDWYEKRSSPSGECFIVGIGFIDVQADEISALREFLQQTKGHAR